MNDMKAIEKRAKRLAGCGRAKLVWIAEAAGIKLPGFETLSENDIRKVIVHSDKPFKVPRR
jgi:hypothetical protein